MATDIVIPIGAKNTASKILEQVGKDTQKLASRVQQTAASTAQSTKAMESAFSGLKAALGPLIAVFAAVKAATFSVDFLRSSSAAFDVQQEAVRGLTKAIELSGNAAGPTIEQHQAFASSLQSLVNVGDEVTLGLMKQASTLGVSNDQLQEATKAATGLAEATGTDLGEAMKKIVGAMNGNSSALAEMIPSIRSATTEQEKFAIIQDVAAKGLAQAADKAKSAEGAATRLANSWGDFKELIGQLLAPLRQVISSGLAVLVEVISSSVIPALNAITPSAEQITAAMETMRVGIVSAVTFAEVIVTNLGSVWEIVKASIELQVIGIVEAIKHAFTVQIPEYTAWFGRNFTTMLSDIFNGAITIVSNAVQNMADIMLRLFEYVRSGFSGGAESVFADIGAIAARGLLEGFEAKTESLPEIAARQLTAGEKELKNTIGTLAGRLGDEYQKKLAERLGVAAGINGPLGLSLAAGPLGQLGKGSAGGQAQLAANESRLLTRGPGSRLTLNESITELVKLTKMSLGLQQDDGARQAAIESAARETQTAIESKGAIMFASPPL